MGSRLSFREALAIARAVRKVSVTRSYRFRVSPSERANQECCKPGNCLACDRLNRRRKIKGSIERKAKDHTGSAPDDNLVHFAPRQVEHSPRSWNEPYVMKP